MEKIKCVWCEKEFTRDEMKAVRVDTRNGSAKLRNEYGSHIDLPFCGECLDILSLGHHLIGICEYCGTISIYEKEPFIAFNQERIRQEHIDYILEKPIPTIQIKRCGVCIWAAGTKISVN